MDTRPRDGSYGRDRRPGVPGRRGVPDRLALALEADRRDPGRPRPGGNRSRRRAQARVRRVLSQRLRLGRRPRDAGRDRRDRHRRRAHRHRLGRANRKGLHGRRPLGPGHDHRLCDARGRDRRAGGRLSVRPDARSRVPPPLRRQLARLDDERDRPRHARDAGDAGRRAGRRRDRRRSDPEPRRLRQLRRGLGELLRHRLPRGGRPAGARHRHMRHRDRPRARRGVHRQLDRRHGLAGRPRRDRGDGGDPHRLGARRADRPSLARPRLRDEPRRRLGQRARRRRRSRVVADPGRRRSRAAWWSIPSTAVSSSPTPAARRCRSSKISSPARPPAPVAEEASPWIGNKLPDFSLEDYRTGEQRTNADFAEKKYILNFFASW